MKSNLIFTVTVTHNPNPSIARIKAGEEFWNRVIDPVLEAHRTELEIGINTTKGGGN